MNQELTTLPIIFLTGLTTGGLTCLALQGALLTSVLMTDDISPLSKGDAPPLAGRGIKTNYKPLFAFLFSKLIAHTILGFLLGILGASISLSPLTRGWLQILIGLYLFGVAGNMLNLHPFFRYFIITPPKSFLKFIKNSPSMYHVPSTLYHTVAAALLGALTVLIPCATTQAMIITALGTASPIYSAAIMFTFILGTIPTFVLFGFLVEKGSVSFQKYFPLVAGTAMFIMSIVFINSGIALTGSPYTLQNFYFVAVNSSPSVIPGTDPESIQIKNNIQSVTITVSNSGYSPRNITLKKGIPVKLKLITNDVSSCSRAFTIPNLNIEKILPETGETIIEFTPTKTGPLAFSCSMGMYTGLFNIIN